ncbi:hypothetical protein [Yoonia sp.]|uniref:hypothetical protein n=1 Tax=Yoonia sp. TaxID=2212373 RepID=UPI0025F16456|nr:hypothetical protein [Yoonia sp.]
MNSKAMYGIAGGWALTIAAAYPLGAETLDAATLGEYEAGQGVDAALSYMVVRQPLTQFLVQLGRDAGIQIVVSGGVKGEIEVTWLEGEPLAILQNLAARYDMEWFAFNDVIYVSDASESLMRLVRLGEISAAAAQDALGAAGLLSDRFMVSETAQGTALALTGPPKLLGLSEAVIESLMVAPEVVQDNRIIVRRGSAVSLEPMRVGDITARMARERAVVDAGDETGTEVDG